MVNEVPSSDLWFIFHYSKRWIHEELAAFYVKAMAPHSSTLAWKIPWTEEPGRLQSMGSLRVRHDWATSLSLFTFMHQRRKWQPTPVFSPGESQGRGSLVGCHLWGHTESDTTEATWQQHRLESTAPVALCAVPVNRVSHSSQGHVSNSRKTLENPLTHPFPHFKKLCTLLHFAFF